MPTFVSPFTGTVVTPTDVTYYALTFSTDQQLDWEAVVNPPEIPAARIMDCVATADNLVVALPVGNEGTQGADILFRNLGAHTFTITDYEGGQSLTIDPGVAKYVYLSDNTTVAGVWQNITFGAATSYADATTLAGYGLTSINGKLSTTQNVIDASTVFPTLNETSRAVTYNWTGGVSTINLPSTAGLSQGWYIGFRNNGTGTLTIQPAGLALINGQTSLETNPGDSGFIMYDNSTVAGFITVGWQTSANVSFTAATYDVDAIIGPDLNLVTYAPIIQTYISQSGARTTQLDVTLPAITQVYMLVNNTNPPLDSQYSITFHNEGSTDPYIELAPGNTLIVLSDGLSLYPLTQTSVGTFYAADGSAEFPSYTFTNNPATGMYLADTNVLGFSANGHEMATFDYSNPTTPLITFNNPLTATLTAVNGGTF